MTISSRTPEGDSNRCLICQQRLRIDPTRPPGDAPCPHCGALVWFDEVKKVTLDKPSASADALLWIDEKKEVQRDNQPALVLKKMLQGKEVVHVRVKSGMFAEMHGSLNNIDDSSGEAKVEIEIFGRPVVVELNAEQLEVIGASQQ